MFQKSNKSASSLLRLKKKVVILKRAATLPIESKSKKKKIQYTYKYYPLTPQLGYRMTKRFDHPHSVRLRASLKLGLGWKEWGRSRVRSTKRIRRERCSSSQSTKRDSEVGVVFWSNWQWPIRAKSNHLTLSNGLYLVQESISQYTGYAESHSRCMSIC